MSDPRALVGVGLFSAASFNSDGRNAHIGPDVESDAFTTTNLTLNEATRHFPYIHLGEALHPYFPIDGLERESLECGVFMSGSKAKGLARGMVMVVMMVTVAGSR